jgi:hypothetical protein
MSDINMHQLAFSSLEYANGYLKVFQHGVESEKPRFNNELLYQMAVMCLEKYLVGLLARYDWPATHHMPLALFKEAKEFDPLLTDEMKQTAILVGKFESICVLEGSGYTMPSKEELRLMLSGIKRIKKVVDQRMKEIEPVGQGD